jgi:methylated-DNA-[protein]-cysteine S-methyltransferase
MNMEARADAAIVRCDVMTTPIGPLTLYVYDDGAVCAIEFGDTSARRGAPRDAGACAHVRRQLDEYFAGERRVFDLPLRAPGSAFQQRVWAALLEIPYGATTSYGDIAHRLGPDVSPRAVGAANGANPIAIVVPCHRVIGSDGSLTGYGGGLGVKARLLELEGAQGTLF